jgi:hypothetical protein
MSLLALPLARLRPLLVPAATLLLPLLAVTVFPAFYQTNDDVAMRLLAEGGLVPDSEPVPFLMHINVVVGQMLTVLYRFLPSLPWYDLVLGASMTAAAAALLTVGAGAGVRRDVLWVAPMVLFFLLPVFVRVQFSFVGLGCVAGGIALLARAALDPLASRQRSLHLVGGTALMVWGGLIRFEGAVLMALEGGLLTLPLAVAAWRDAGSRRRLRASAVCAAAALLSIGLSFAANQLAYARARGWSEFHEHNFLRALLTEYAAPSSLRPELIDRLGTSVGWSRNDFGLLIGWFYTDPELFSLRRMRDSVTLLRAKAPPASSEFPGPGRLAGAMLPRRDLVHVGEAFLVMTLFVLGFGAQRRLLLFLAGAALTFAVLTLLIGLGLKPPPERVYWPMLILVAATLALAARRWGVTARPAVAAGSSFVLALVLTAALHQLYQQAQARRRGAEAARGYASALQGIGASTFVLHADAFPLEDWWRPLQVAKPPFPFVPLGVSARTPPVQDFLRRTGRLDLPLALCSEPGLVVVSGSYLPVLLTRFVKEHHGIDVTFEALLGTERFTVWECRRLPAAPGEPSQRM